MKKILAVAAVGAFWIFLLAFFLRGFPIAVENEASIPEVIHVFAQPTVVKAGQTWVYYGDEKNPFSTYSKEMRVVAVKDGYVKYYVPKWDEYNSEPIQYFLIGSRLVGDRPKEGKEKP